jgi:hypothetical protein
LGTSFASGAHTFVVWAHRRHDYGNSCRDDNRQERWLEDQIFRASKSIAVVMPEYGWTNLAKTSDTALHFFLLDSPYGA